MERTRAARAGLSCRTCWTEMASNVAIVAVWRARHSHLGASTTSSAARASSAPGQAAVGSTGRGREAAAGTGHGWKWWDRSAAPRPKTWLAIRVQQRAGSWAGTRCTGCGGSSDVVGLGTAGRLGLGLRRAVGGGARSRRYCGCGGAGLHMGWPTRCSFGSSCQSAALGVPLARVDLGCAR